MQNLATLVIYQLSRLAAAVTCSGGSIETGTGSATNSFDTCLPSVAANNSAVTTVLQLVFGVIGAVAIVYIMYGAFRFVRSQGEPKEIAQSRQTIIFAIIGLVVALSAEAIVSLALGKF